MNDPTIADLRVAPNSPWSGVCDVCREGDVELLCGGCRAGLHDRCSKTHRQGCADLAGRLVPLHASAPLLALDAERGTLGDEEPLPDIDPEETP